MTKLNLGCSDRHLPGYVNVDRVPPADLIVDLSIEGSRGFEPGADDGPLMRALSVPTGWRGAWDDSTIDEIVAHDIIEHLPDKILTMNQFWRVLKPSGRVDISVPTTDGPGAFQDPTHISYWHRNSFWYYTAGDPHRERFGDAYGVKARFAVMDEQIIHGGHGIVHLHIVLEAIK